jgi:hypothetical protein
MFIIQERRVSVESGNYHTRWPEREKITEHIRHTPTITRWDLSGLSKGNGHPPFVNGIPFVL